MTKSSITTDSQTVGSVPDKDWQIEEVLQILGNPH